MDFKKIKAGFVDAVSSMDDKLKDSLSFMSDIKEAGADKLKALVTKIQEAAPLIDKAGYKMHEIEVGIGIPPDIAIAFSKEADVDQATIDQLLKDNEDRPLFKLIVQTLQKADAIVKGMNMYNFKMGEMIMTVGIPPNVGIKLFRLEDDELEKGVTEKAMVETEKLAKE